MSVEDLHKTATPGEWAVHYCSYVEPGRACGVYVVGTAEAHGQGPIMVFEDGAGDECHHVISKADAEHIVGMHNAGNLRGHL